MQWLPDKDKTVDLTTDPQRRLTLRYGEKTLFKVKQARRAQVWGRCRRVRQPHPGRRRRTTCLDRWRLESLDRKEDDFNALLGGFARFPNLSGQSSVASRPRQSLPHTHAGVPARHFALTWRCPAQCDVADGRLRAAGTGAPSWYFLASGDTATVSSWTPVLLGHGVTGDTRKLPAELCEVPERSRGVQVRHVCVSRSVRHPVPWREGSVLWEVTPPITWRPSAIRRLSPTCRPRTRLSAAGIKAASSRLRWVDNTWPPPAWLLCPPAGLPQEADAAPLGSRCQARVEWICPRAHERAHGPTEESVTEVAERAKGVRSAVAVSRPPPDSCAEILTASGIRHREPGWEGIRVRCHVRSPWRD